MQWQTKSIESDGWSNYVIIVSSAKKETVVGIMIVLHPLYVVDMEAENPFNGGNVESLELGSTTEKHNGNSQVAEWRYKE